MSQEYPVSWLFLLFNLPAKHSRDRVKVWRRLKRFGAIQLKTSTYVLPDAPVHYERFQSLAKEIVDNGGESALEWLGEAGPERRRDPAARLSVP
jgi:hypothetical protein